MKKNILILLLFIGISVLAILFAQQYNKTTTIVHHSPIKITALKIRAKTVELFTETSGRISACNSAEVRPQVSGIILKRLFEEGSNVVENQQLYQIDPASFEANLNSAKANLNKLVATKQLNELKLSRARNLTKSGFESKQDLENLELTIVQNQADIDVAQNDITIAELNLEYTKVRAPISGVINKSLLSVGSLVNIYTSLLTTITQVDTLFVDLSLPIKTIRTKHNSNINNCTLYIDQYNDTPYPHPTKLLFSSVLVDPTTSSVNLRAEVANPDQQLLPGMFIRAKLYNTKTQAILIPQSATIRLNGGQLYVWLIQPNNSVKMVKVTAEQATQSAWLITAGLNSGDVIITEGFYKIKEGDILEPNNITIQES